MRETRATNRVVDGFAKTTSGYRRAVYAVIFITCLVLGIYYGSGGPLVRYELHPSIRVAIQGQHGAEVSITHGQRADIKMSSSMTPVLVENSTKGPESGEVKSPAAEDNGPTIKQPITEPITEPTTEPKSHESSDMKGDNKSHPPRTHWRLYGGASFNNDGITHEEKEGKLFSFSSMSPELEKLVTNLQSNPIACSHHSNEYRESLSNKLSQFLKSLSDYATFHAQNRRNDSSSKIVFWSGGGGIADRFRGLTFTMILAMATQRVLLINKFDTNVEYENVLESSNIIDWRLTQEEKQRAYENRNGDKNPNAARYLYIGAAPGMDALIKDPEYEKYLNIIGSSRLWIAVETNMLPSSLVHHRVPKSIEWIKKAMVSLGLDGLSQFEFDSLMGIAFRYLFRFSDEIARELASARTVLGLTNLTYVGIHVRTGHFNKNFIESHYKLNTSPKQWEKVLNCSKSAIKHKVPLFVATDSTEMKEYAVHNYGSIVRSLNNSVIHVNIVFDKTSQALTTAQREGIKSMWIELVLLAEADTVVMGKSGYSFFAQGLCLIPQSRVLDGDRCKHYNSMV